MACKLTNNIKKSNCEYQLAGVARLYVFNFSTETTYTLGTNNVIEKIELPTGDKVYSLDFIDNTASWSDDLAVNGNGGKYRTHTLNFTLSDYDYNLLNQGDALSLGKFTAVVVDKSGRSICLGRINGLSATSFNYASGTADADANGWTTVMASTETETGRLLKDESVVKSLLAEDVQIVP